MQKFGHSPYSANHKQMNTAGVRLAMVLAAILFGSVLALFTASESLPEAASFVDKLLLGHFSGRGLIIFAAVLALALAYIRLQSPHWTLLIFAGVVWWSIHFSKGWTMDRFMMREFNEARESFVQPMRSR